MTAGIHLLIGGPNLLSGATLTAGAVRPSTAIRRLTAAVRQGTGRVSLTGSYTGAAAKRIDVEIRNGGTTPHVSTPVPAGVGTGTLTDLQALPGATAQTYTLTLIDTGIQTATAKAVLGGYTVTARSAGAAGNQIEMAVDESGLTATASEYSLLEDISEGTDDLTGPGWDWNSAPASSEDEIPADAGRCFIGSERRRVYRYWKAWTGDEWHYRISPAAVRKHKKGERIYTVTGGRTVTVTDGVSPETYPDIITTRDLLQALDGSALVQPETIPGSELTLDNTAAYQDLSLRTTAREDYTTGIGSEYATGFIDTYVGQNAATEIVTATCIGNSAAERAGLGNELWAWQGTVSGKNLGTTRTGSLFRGPAGRWGARVPVRLPEGYEAGARGSIWAEVNLVDRADGEDYPQICIDELKLGTAALGSGSVTYTWAERPGKECSCKGGSYKRLPHANKCLGLDIEEGADMGVNPHWFTRRRAPTFQWYSNFFDSNSQLTADGEPQSAYRDQALGQAVVEILDSVLVDLRDNDAEVEWPQWTADMEVTEGMIIEPPTRNGYRYQADRDGTTGSSAPTFGTVIGGDTADYGINWRCLSKTPLKGYDDLLQQVETELAALEGLDADGGDFEALPTWTANTIVSRGDKIRPVVIDSNGDASPLANRAPVLVALLGGETEVSYPDTRPGGSFQSFARGNIISDGEVLWLSLGNRLELWSDKDINTEEDDSSGITSRIDAFVKPYQAAANLIRVNAGLEPDFPNASLTGTGGSECWRDCEGSSHIFEAAGTDYLHACVNQEYVSARLNAEGEPESTQEFGFVPKVNTECSGLLKAGDSYTISWDNAGWGATYQVGDVLEMAVIAASPLSLTGGVDGNDQHTWSFRRSVDGMGSNYVQNMDNPGLYDDGNVQFRLQPGGVAHQAGFTWSWCISAAAYRWQEDEGGYGAASDLVNGLLIDGVQIEFTEGACPPWVEGDTASFDLLQPYALASSENPDSPVFAWADAGFTIQKTCSGTVTAVALVHTLPATAVVTVTDGASLNEILTWQEGVMVLPLDAALTDPTLTIQVANAAGGEITWMWAGRALAFETQPGEHPDNANADRQTRTVSYNMQRGNGPNPAALLNGSGHGIRLEECYLSHDSAQNLLSLFQWAKEGGDYPVIAVPHKAIPAEAYLARLPDRLPITDIARKYQAADTDVRLHPITLELAPWYR